MAECCPKREGKIPFSLIQRGITDCVVICHVAIVWGRVVISGTLGGDRLYSKSIWLLECANHALRRLMLVYVEPIRTI